MTAQQLKNSILQMAVQGKLVPQDPNDEPASVLLERIRAEKERLIKEKKIKREKTGEMSLNLKPTRDIAAFLGNLKNDTEHQRRLLVGFALETHNEQMNAEDKLNRKNLDFIVLNSLNDKGAGFRCDTNKISIIDHQGKTDYPLKSKAEVAADIVDRLVKDLNSK